MVLLFNHSDVDFEGPSVRSPSPEEIRAELRDSKGER